jgi:hypothetical protein
METPWHVNAEVTEVHLDVTLPLEFLERVVEFGADAVPDDEVVEASHCEGSVSSEPFQVL